MALAAQALLQKGGNTVQQQAGDALLILSGGESPHKNGADVVKAGGVLQRRHLGIGIVQNVGVLPVQIQLHHKGVGIAQQGMVFGGGHIHGVEAVGPVGDGQRQIQLFGFGGLPVGIGAGQRLKLAGNVLEALQQLGGEHAALAPQDHVHGGAEGVGLFIHPLRGEGIKYVGQTHHLCADGDVITGNALGIAAAVPPLVVVVTDVVGIAQVFLVGQIVQTFQNVTAGEGVGLHDLPLHLGERAGLVQDGIGDGDLAYIVQGGGAGDDGDGAVVQVILGTGPGHLLQQEAGEAADTQDVLSRLHTAVFDNGGQNVHHVVVGLAQQQGLLGHQLLQMALVEIELHDVVDAALHGVGLIVQGDDVGSTQLKGLVEPRGVFVGENDDDRHLQDVFLHIHPQVALGELFGGAHIQQYGGNELMVLLQQQTCLTAVVSLQQIEALGKDLPQKTTAFCRAAGQKQGIPFIHKATS